MQDVQALVVAELATVHGVFERWLRGAADSLDRVEAALAHAFTIVSPRGTVLTREDLLHGLADARGSRRIRIRVENPRVRWTGGAAVLATYEEWHDHEGYSTARQSTALFTRDGSAPGGVRWQHVHETWITPPPTWTVPPPRLG